MNNECYLHVCAYLFSIHGYRMCGHSMPVSHVIIACMVHDKLHAKQKHLGCKKVRGQSEATLQTDRRDQKV